MKSYIRIFWVVAMVSVLGACTPKGVDITRFGLEDAVIAEDLGVFPQDLAVYAERAGKDTALMEPARQGGEDARFDANFFSPWDAGVPLLSKNDAFEALLNMDPGKGFAENLRPWPRERWQAIVANANMDGYGAVPARPAITVGTAHLRRLPTEFPYFLDPGRGGEGFPFDYMQSSTLWLGTPVAVTHVSRDGMWAFAQTGLVSGWTRVTNLAAVDRNFIRTWRSRPLAVFVQDNVVLAARDRMDAVANGRVAAEAQVGTILPFATVKGRIEVAKSPHVFVHVPLRASDGNAVMATAFAPMYAARQKPLHLTPQNVALIGNAMMGQPYGWGGLFGQRDCSAAMHDLFAPFGIWLPRNSSPQGAMGARVELGGLSPDGKEEKIMREGLPFFSLVGMPGHIGLYLGAYPRPDGKGGEREVPVMFHNVWGVRVAPGQGENRREGRGVIGKAVVTGLRYGAEHPEISSPASVLDRITGLAVLPDPLPGERATRR